MKRQMLSLILLFSISFCVFSNGPYVTDKFYFRDGGKTIYLGMKLSEVKDLLGEADEIEKIKGLPYHLDIVIWKYKALWVYSHDVPDDYISMIAVPWPNTILTFMTVNQGYVSEIETLYGKPHSVNKYDDKIVIYHYGFVHALNNHTYFIEFCFDEYGKCTQILLYFEDFMA